MACGAAWADGLKDEGEPTLSIVIPALAIDAHTGVPDSRHGLGASVPNLSLGASVHSIERIPTSLPEIKPLEFAMVDD